MLLTSQAVTTAGGRDWHADRDPDHLRALTVATFAVLAAHDAALASRVAGQPEVPRPLRAAARQRRGPRGPAVIADVVAAVLVVVSTAYAALAGADFGGGDLGPAGRFRGPRRGPAAVSTSRSPRYGSRTMSGW